jgi:hypothetical protein
MIDMKVSIVGLDALRSNFAKAPGLTLKYLAQATEAAIFEVDSHVNEGGIMQFKTPRPLRTGQLVARWGVGDARGFSRDRLSGYTGPSVKYASAVYHGTKRGGPNKYLDRITRVAEPGVQKHFQDAVNKVVAQTAKL